MILNGNIIKRIMSIFKKFNIDSVSVVNLKDGSEEYVYNNKIYCIEQDYDGDHYIYYEESLSYLGNVLEDDLYTIVFVSKRDLLEYLTIGNSNRRIVGLKSTGGTNNYAQFNCDNELSESLLFQYLKNEITADEFVLKYRKTNE